MRQVRFVLGITLVGALTASGAGAFQVSGGALFTPFGLDLVRCSVVHSHPKRLATFEVRLYNAAGTLVASNSCGAASLGQPCWVDHDPTGTGHLCVADVKGVPAKSVRGSLCAHENTSANPIACLPVTRH